MTDSEEMQWVRYTSSNNITFKGDLETGLTKSEWAALSDAEREEFLTEMVWELVEISEIDK